MPGLQTYLETLKNQIQEIDASTTQKFQGQGALVIDVRDEMERSQGIIPGSLAIGRDFLEMKIHEHAESASQAIVLYCAGGTRSLLAGANLVRLGFTKVYSLTGGITGWKSAGFPTEIPPSISTDFHQRYQKHLLLPEIGQEGQQKLSRAKILVVGAGGLASPALAYLAAAGMGTIGVVDNDYIDISNLQRQVIHRSHDIGMSKTESALRFIRELNPHIKTVGYRDRLQQDNCLQIIESYDLVLDCTDNFQSRFLINDACIKAAKTHIHAAIFRFLGEVTVFDHRRTTSESPCYRCLFPEPPPPEQAPSCSEAGVLGVLPGIMGTLQAHEAIKVLLELPNPLVGRVLRFDGLQSKFSEILLSRDPQCRCSFP